MKGEERELTEGGQGLQKEDVLLMCYLLFAADEQVDRFFDRYIKNKY